MNLSDCSSLFRAGLLNISTMGQNNNLFEDSCSVYCRVFGNIPGLYLLDARSILLPVDTTKNVSQPCQYSLLEKSSQVDNIVLKVQSFSKIFSKTFEYNVHIEKHTSMKFYFGNTPR